MADKTPEERAGERMNDAGPVEILEHPDPTKTVRAKPSKTPIRRPER